MDLKTRFMSKVVVAPDGCWIWTGGFRNEYGAVKVAGKVEYAHRVAWTLFRGPIPEGEVLLHSCDFPACVNPDHLKPGQQRENIVDAITKGRMKPFRPTRSEPLTIDEIAAINRDYVGGVSLRQLSRKYNVARASLMRLISPAN